MIDFTNVPITEARTAPAWPSDDSWAPSVQFTKPSYDKLVFAVPSSPWFAPVIQDLKALQWYLGHL